ncbi:hypothetical protein D3C74_465830 [compost metagenome]
MAVCLQEPSRCALSEQEIHQLKVWNRVLVVVCCAGFQRRFNDLSRSKLQSLVEDQFGRTLHNLLASLVFLLTEQYNCRFQVSVIQWTACQV